MGLPHAEDLDPDDAAIVRSLVHSIAEDPRVDLETDAGKRHLMKCVLIHVGLHPAEDVVEVVEADGLHRLDTTPGAGPEAEDRLARARLLLGYAHRLEKRDDLVFLPDGTVVERSTLPLSRRIRDAVDHAGARLRDPLRDRR